uniref:Uncharacterized protein n=1 Tax=Ceratitis capitata TaxID=7213 RepID=W8AVL9_CERCA
MAYSTQKEFFHVPFMNETVDYECLKACVKLKTYQSTIDDRSWAMDESLQSRFLSDLITCQTPVGGFGDGNDEDEDDSNDIEAGGTSRARRRGTGAGRLGGGPGRRMKRGADFTEKGYTSGMAMSDDQGAGLSGGPGGGSGGGPGSGRGGAGPGGADGRAGKAGLVTADSVLACATEQMGRMEDLLLHKKNLEKQLEVSNERLRVASLENDKIKAIMSSKFDSNHSKDFHNKIQKLTSSGKINKGEENELIQIYNKFEDMSKAYEILQAENVYLKRLMEKLSYRANFETLKMEPEKSNDVGFLQNEVNKLRKEVSILRKFEDEKLKSTGDTNRNRMTDQDADNLKAIIKERNALREKCKTFKDLETKVHELQKIAKEADKMSDNLSDDLDKQSKYIHNMENEMKDMQEYYEDQMGKLKFNEELLKCQLEEMKEDLIRARCCAQKAECLQMEIATLRNELMRRDLALSDYDCQYKQLMNVIDELQGNAIQNLHDTQTQTCTDYMDDLTFFARATLDEIKKEIKKRGGDGDKIGGGFFAGSAITDGLSPEECCTELRRLHEVVKQMSKQNEYLQNNLKKAAEEMCADALKRLTEMEEKYNNLKHDKDALNMRTVDKLNEFSDRVDKMGTDVGKTALETADMEKDLKESMKLVRDISDMQLKNAQLANAVNALTTRDDQKLIDDLRRQLLEEQARNKKCQEENNILRELLEKRGIDPYLATKDIVKETGDGQRMGSPGVDLAIRSGLTGVDQVGIPDAVRVERTVGPAGGHDASRTGGPGASQAGGPDTAGAVGPDTSRAGGTDAVKAGGPSTVREGGPGAGQVRGPDAARAGGPGAPEAVGPGTGQAGGPNAARVGGPAGGPDGTRVGPDPAGDTDVVRAGSPGAGQAEGPGATRAVEPGAREAGGPDASRRGAPDAAKAGGPAGGPAAGQVGGPAAGQAGGPDAVRAGGLAGGPGADQAGGADAARVAGPVGGPDVARSGSPGTGQTDAARTGDADATRVGGPAAGPTGRADAVREGGPGAGQVSDADATRAGAPGAGQVGGRGAGQVGSPGAGLVGGPGADQGGGPGAGQGGGPGAGQVGGSGAGQVGGAGAGPVGGPGAGPVGGPGAGPAGGPGASQAVGPGAGQVGGPGAGQFGGPDTTRAGGLGVGEPGRPDDGRGGGPNASELGGSGAGRSGGPEAEGGPDRAQRVGPGGIRSESSPGRPRRGGTPGERGSVGDDYSDRPDGGDGLGVGGGTGRGRAAVRTEKGDGVGGAGAGGRGPSRRGDLSAVGGGGGRSRRGKGAEGPGDDAFERFIDSNANAMMTNIRAGSALEKELRAILNAFMMECGFCFCKSLVPKSKFYALCHKLLHNGIQCMAFRDLAYMHRKIFMAADKLHPGCLLDMILTELGFKDGDAFKCCQCKNALCCSNSEEMLKEKVSKLERDIEMAKEYLDSLKAQPKSHRNPYTASGRKTYRQVEDSYSDVVEELLTCRETRPPSLSKTHSKQMKTLKARIMKCSELLR